MQKGGIRGAWFETRLHWEVISTHHLPVVGCTWRRKLPLGVLLLNMYHATFPGKVLPHCAKRQTFIKNILLLLIFLVNEWVTLSLQECPS